ncbi:MAG: hypothetical protein JKY37_08640 [Nannocystaceae bacterium]|nr:hypothetical protein [Nannocystaceae bacterium]
MGIQIITESGFGSIPVADDLIEFAEREGWSGTVPPLADRFEEIVDHFYPGEFHNGVSVLIAPDMTIAIKRTSFEPSVTAEDIDRLR